MTVDAVAPSRPDRPCPEFHNHRAINTRCQATYVDLRTRRTLNNTFARDRSINFCTFRILPVPCL